MSHSKTFFLGTMGTMNRECRIEINISRESQTRRKGTLPSPSLDSSGEIHKGEWKMKDSFLESFVERYTEPIFSANDRKRIKQHLLGMKCDPTQIDKFIWFLEAELRPMKYVVLPNYAGNLQHGVFRNNTKNHGGFILTREDMKDLLKCVDRFIDSLNHFHLRSDDSDDFSLIPICRSFADSGEFYGLTAEVGKKLKTIYPLLVGLQPMLKKAIEFSTFTKKGRTPKEYKTNFAYHVVNGFYVYFKKLPSATTRNSHFEQILEICYQTLNLQATDLSKTIKRAILEYSEKINQ